jgi:asparagine synthase (glutamine-hydrolysing)
MRRAYQWHLDFDLMEADAIDGVLANPPRHDWIEQATTTRPGKIGHIALLLRVQNHVEGYLRGFGLPMIDPLMSPPIMELALRIPTWKMIEGGRNRAVARRAYADLLPPLIRDRRRKGSPSSFAVDLASQRIDEIRERLMNGELVKHGLLSRSALDAALVRGAPIDRHYVRLMALLDMEAWIARWKAAPKN